VRDRTARPIGELIERTVESQSVECAIQQRDHVFQRQQQQWDAADDCSRAFATEQIDVFQACRVHPVHTGLRKFALQLVGELGAVLDQRQPVFGDAAGDDRPREDAGSGSELYDRR